MRIRDITENHHYPIWLLRFPRLIYIHYVASRILFLRSRICHRWIRKLIINSPKRQLRILDAGCGEGQYLIPQATRWSDCTFTGIDQLKDHIAFLTKLVNKKRITNCHLEIIDIKAYLSGGPEVDLIYMIGVLQYLPCPEKVLNLMGQTQSPGQQVLLYTPIRTTIHYKFYQWIRSKYGHYDDAQEQYNPIKEKDLYEWIENARYRIAHKEYHYKRVGTLGHEIMQSLIILWTNWPMALKIIPALFFIILMPIFVSLQVVDGWFPSRHPKRGNGLLLILEKQSIRG